MLLQSQLGKAFKAKLVTVHSSMSASVGAVAIALSAVVGQVTSPGMSLSAHALILVFCSVVSSAGGSATYAKKWTATYQPKVINLRRSRHPSVVYPSAKGPLFLLAGIGFGVSGRLASALATGIADELSNLPKHDAATLRALRRRVDADLAAYSAKDIVRIAERIMESGAPGCHVVACELILHRPDVLATIQAKDLERLGRSMASWGEVDTFVTSWKPAARRRAENGRTIRRGQLRPSAARRKSQNGVQSLNLIGITNGTFSSTSIHGRPRPVSLMA